MANLINTNHASLLISAGFVSQFPSDSCPQIAFSGRSNVGKSSLINRLLNRHSLARVSASPGKTVTINFYDIDRKLFFVDLPGYGFAKRPKEEQKQWANLTDAFFTRNPNRDRLMAVFQLIDSRTGITKDDRMMIQYLKDTETPFLIIVTKIDKLNKTERNRVLEEIASCDLLDPSVPILPFSSLSGEGKNEVWAAVYSLLK